MPKIVIKALDTEGSVTTKALHQAEDATGHPALGTSEIRRIYQADKTALLRHGWPPQNSIWTVAYQIVLNHVNLKANAFEAELQLPFRSKPEAHC